VGLRWETPLLPVATAPEKLVAPLLTRGGGDWRTEKGIKGLGGGLGGSGKGSFRKKPVITETGSLDRHKMQSLVCGIWVGNNAHLWLQCTGVNKNLGGELNAAGTETGCSPLGIPDEGMLRFCVCRKGRTAGDSEKNGKKAGGHSPVS